MTTSAPGPSVCPHCWMVNPAPFEMCARCGARMDTLLQESAGLRRTAPVQSPVPVGDTARFGPVTRLVIGTCVAVIALAYLVHLLPRPAAPGTPNPAPASAPR